MPEIRHPPSPETTFAVILGVSKCPRSPHLADLPGAANAANNFRVYLAQSFGLPDCNLKYLFDSTKSQGDQLGEIGDWLFGNKRLLRDLLVYYVGHGGFTPRDRQFFLATSNTTERQEGNNSIRIVDFANTLDVNAPWARKYLIFDCCFAGAVAKDLFMSSAAALAVDKTKKEFPSKGTAVLCSSSSQDVSIATSGAQYTRFSEALFEALNTGNDQVSARLSLYDVGMRARQHILEKFPNDRSRPEVHSPSKAEGDVALVEFFPNPGLEQTRLEAEVARKEKERLQRESQSTTAPNTTAQHRRLHLVAKLSPVAFILLFLSWSFPFWTFSDFPWVSGLGWLSSVCRGESSSSLLAIAAFSCPVLLVSLSFLNSRWGDGEKAFLWLIIFGVAISFVISSFWGGDLAPGLIVACTLVTALVLSFIFRSLDYKWQRLIEMALSWTGLTLLVFIFWKRHPLYTEPKVAFGLIAACTLAAAGALMKTWLFAYTTTADRR